MLRFLAAAWLTAAVAFAGGVAVHVAHPVAVAVAQPAPVQPAPNSTVVAQPGSTIVAAPETRIDIGRELAPWVQYLIAAAVAFIMALFAALTEMLRRWTNTQNSKAADDAERIAREVVHSAAQSAAGWVLVKYGDAVKGKMLELHSPAIRDAVQRVNAGALDSARKLGLDDEAKARMVLEKIGILTAANTAAPQLKGPVA